MTISQMRRLARWFTARHAPSALLVRARSASRDAAATTTHKTADATKRRGTYQSRVPLAWSRQDLSAGRQS